MSQEWASQRHSGEHWDALWSTMHMPDAASARLLSAVVPLLNMPAHSTVRRPHGAGPHASKVTHMPDRQSWTLFL
jgi:hypothetical protein